MPGLYDSYVMRMLAAEQQKQEQAQQDEMNMRAFAAQESERALRARAQQLAEQKQLAQQQAQLMTLAGKEKEIDWGRQYDYAKLGNEMAKLELQKQQQAQQAKQAELAREDQLRLEKQQYTEKSPEYKLKQKELEKQNALERLGFIRQKQQDFGYLAEPFKKISEAKNEEEFNNAMDYVQRNYPEQMTEDMPASFGEKENMKRLGYFDKMLKEGEEIERKYVKYPDIAEKASLALGHGTNLKEAEQDPRFAPYIDKLLNKETGPKIVIDNRKLDEMSPGTKKELEDALRGSDQLLAKAERIKKYLPNIEDFTTYYGNFRNKYLSIKGKSGADLTPEEKTTIQDYRKFQENVKQLFNAYRKTITGASAQMAELKDLENSMINMNLSPNEIVASLDNLIETAQEDKKLAEESLRRKTVEPYTSSRLDFDPVSIVKNKFNPKNPLSFKKWVQSQNFTREQREAIKDEINRMFP
jgi:hypothetical protein